MDDVPSAHGLITAWEAEQIGLADTFIEDLREMWQDLDLLADSFLVHAPDDTLVGLATLAGRSRLRAEICVRPGHEDPLVTTCLHTLVDARVRERRSAGQGSGPLSVDTWASSTDDATIALLRSRGYQLLERYHRMRIDMHSPPLDITWPEGVRPRNAVRGQDERAVFDAAEAAKSDGPDYEPEAYETWHRRLVDTQRYDPSLWWLAMAGSEIVGVALGIAFPDTGWIRFVGVRPAWRRHGIASALLRTAFAGFWDRRIRSVQLGVDPDGVYGAQQLYARAGMRPAFELQQYRMAFPPA
jgi:ribosomal protein S18 acetylase RimI-like enzyme